MRSHAMIVGISLLLSGLAGCGSSKSASEKSPAVQKVEKLGGEARQSTTLQGAPITSVNFTTKKITDKDLQGLIDDGSLTEVTSVDVSRTSITPAGLDALAKLKKLTVLDVGGLGLKDDDLSHLSALTGLETLGLDSNPINGEGLGALKPLEKLTNLDLGETKITDDGVAKLESLASIEELELDDNAITDAAVDHLSKLKNLKAVDLSNTKLTEAGREKLKKALPNVELKQFAD